MNQVFYPKIIREFEDEIDDKPMIYFDEEFSFGKQKKDCFDDQNHVFGN